MPEEVVAGPRRAIPKRLTYLAAAMLVSLGAPVGLVIVESLQRGTLGIDAIGQQLARERWTYVYVAVSSLVAFSLFGHALGRQADRLLALARTDTLTGLGNARGFRDRLHEELARFARYRQPLSLLLLDLDGLKAINDSHGHRAGDAALVQLGAEIGAECRSTDSAARWGGDEFAVLAPNTPEAAALALGQRIRARVASQHAVSGLAVSIGVATLCAPATGAAADDLVRTADRALYQAKRAGGNRVVSASATTAA
jgi:diguanylate cyclase (GGDEF)-like protein